MVDGETHARECKLLAGPVSIAAQGVLLSIVVASLLYKRNTETPKRPLLVWFMDISKQLASSGIAHFVAMGIAVLAQIVDSGVGTSECSWYFVVYSVDTVLGMPLVISFHELCVLVARRHLPGHSQGASIDMSVLSSEGSRSNQFTPSIPCNPPQDERKGLYWEYIADCGNYGEPPNVKKWAVQLFQFTICVVTARMCCGVVVIALSGTLASGAVILDEVFKGHPVELLLFVMVVFPVCMNTLQAWIQDHFLMWAKRSGPVEQEGVRLLSGAV